jgi:hypothetical protein
MPKSEIKEADVKSMNIFQRMLAIQSEIPVVAKNLNVETGGYGRSYRAVSERDVKDAIKPLECKYGVYSFPIKKELIDQSFLEQTTKNGTKKSFYSRERITYRFVNVDKPEEFIEIDGYGDGIDTSDKATGKADTYASKYCLMSAYKVSTGDDPDKDASQEYNTKGVDVSQLAVQLTTVRTKLTKLGVDLHDETFVNFVKDKAKVATIDPGALLMDADGMQRVIAVMNAVVNAKTSKPKDEIQAQ